MDLEVERAALVALLHPPAKFEWAVVRDQLEEREREPSAVLRDRVGGDRAFDEAIDLASTRIAQWAESDATFLTYLDAEYPQHLLEAHDFPPFLFAKGDLSLAAGKVSGISIVGSRKPDAWAIQSAQDLAAKLIEHGIPVVSGLAEGIDSAAHSTALRLGAKTVGIIGTGIDKYYPASSKPLQTRMEQGQGLVLSQFWPGSSPTRYSFPMRNGVMSAYSIATVIIQASEKSGTRHQAFRAIAHGRPVILTRAVAEQTTWGKALSEDPLKDVTVADTLEQAVQLCLIRVRRPALAGITL